MLTYEQVLQNEEIKIYIRKADEALGEMGFTEHSFAHVGKVSHIAKQILLALGHSERQAELAQIAGYLHDIGNVINRADHAQSGAVMAFRILDHMDADPSDIAEIISAIGNHDEGTAVPVSPMAAALILADKTDVRRSRVRNRDLTTFDIHDRVNYAVEESRTEISSDLGFFTLVVKLDTGMSSVMDYFEIFLGRMLLCRKAAEKLGLQFRMVVNGQVVV